MTGDNYDNIAIALGIVHHNRAACKPGYWRRPCCLRRTARCKAGTGVCWTVAELPWPLGLTLQPGLKGLAPATHQIASL